MRIPLAVVAPIAILPVMAHVKRIRSGKNGTKPNNSIIGTTVIVGVSPLLKIEIN